MASWSASGSGDGLDGVQSARAPAHGHRLARIALVLVLQRKRSSRFESRLVRVGRV